MIAPQRLPILFVLAAVSLPAQDAGPKDNPTFTEDVAAIVFNRCAHCHRPDEVAPFPLLSYRDVRKRGRNLLEAVEQRFMPPWHPAPGYGSFRNEARLSAIEIATLRAWVRTGMPEGPKEALPKLPEFTAGWQLGEPDMVISTQGAFKVPARGRDIYRNFSIPLGFDEDKYVTAIEVRPSARDVLHHTIIMLDADRDARQYEGKDGQPGFRGMRVRRAPMIAGWAVGGMPEHLPEGLAIRIPKGSDLVLQSHFHPSGRAQKEQTTIGLHFADKPPQRTLVAIQVPPFFGAMSGIDIPANEADYRVKDTFELPCDVEAVSVGGHAHLLCTSMQLHAIDPDGKEIPLLKIDDWDFDWQNRYTYRALVPLPKGAKIYAEIVYDNSRSNPNNPHKPPKAVKWGRETTDEMGSITLVVVPRDEADLEALQDAVKAKFGERATANIRNAIERQFADYDKNNDGELQKNEVPARMRLFFDRLDSDGNGSLSREEAKAIEKLLGGGRRD